jgi:TPR repeat protein
LDTLEPRVEAYKWLQLAATQGYKGSAEACERVTLGMSRDEVAEGNRRTVEFVPHKPSELQTR